MQNYNLRMVWDMKKKILFIHHSGGLGGAPKSLAFLIEKLDNLQYEPIVLTIADGPVVKLFEEAGAKVIIKENLYPFHGTTVSGMRTKLFIKNFLYVLPTYFRAKKMIKDINPDLIHLNTTCLFIFAKAAKEVIDDIKIVSHVREPLLESFSGKILKYMNHKYVDAFIPISNYDKSKLNLKNRYSKVIYNFVDFDVYNSDIESNILRKELNLNKDDILFIYLARFASSNGTLEMIKMLNEWDDMNSNFHFAMIGYNPKNKSKYNQNIIRESKKNSNIHIIEFRNDIPEVIASVDVMVCPFIEPHFSRGIIEAAAMGVPSIASDIGGPNELVVNKKTGLLYRLNNNRTFYKAINKIGENKKYREKLGENAENYALENFNSKKNAKDTFDVYEYLLNSKS